MKIEPIGKLYIAYSIKLPTFRYKIEDQVILDRACFSVNPRDTILIGLFSE